MSICSWERGSGELALAQEQEEQAMQLFLEKWDVFIWDSMSVRAHEGGVVDGGDVAGCERHGRVVV